MSRPQTPSGKPPETHTDRLRYDRRRIAQVTAWTVLTILLTLFAALNTDTVEVDWIFGSGKAPLILVIIVAFLAGIAFTLLARRRAGRRRAARAPARQSKHIHD